MRRQIGGQAMSKEEQAMMDLWDIFKKRIWLDSFKMKDTLRSYNPSEIHCIAYIGEDEDSNVTKLAGSFDMTRGAISKLTKKLVKKGLIESYQKPDNKKEVYFKLTEPGKAIYNIHAEMHREFKDRDQPFFEQVTEEQLDVILGFAEKYNMHLDAEMKKLDVDMKPDNL
jgi:DNA-binding MarR family transcriptional regulator